MVCSILPAQMAWADDPSPGFDGTDYGRLRGHLSRAVARVCPGMSADRREDLVQDCVLRVMDVAQKSPEARRFNSSYLYRVAYSALIDEVRRIRRRGEVPLEPEGEPLPVAAVEGNPETLASGREIGRGILACLSGLRKERRLGVTLYLQGHTVEEAARILDWSVKRVANLVYRGMADLRACLQAKGMRP